MKKTTLALAIIGTMYFFAECSSSKVIVTTPTSAELTVAQKRWPEASQESLNNGYTIYTTKCNTCHGLKDVPKLSEKKWEHEIDVMAPKAKLTANEKELLRQYILSTREVALTQNNK